MIETLNKIRDYLHPTNEMQIFGLIGFFLWIIFAWIMRNEKNKKGVRRGFLRSLLDSFWIILCMFIMYKIHPAVLIVGFGGCLVAGIVSEFCGKS